MLITDKQKHILSISDKVEFKKHASPRPPIDFSKFFLRYGDQEQEAISAFDFLNEMSASDTKQTDVSESHATIQSQPVTLSQSKAPEQTKPQEINQSNVPIYSRMRMGTRVTVESKLKQKQPQHQDRVVQEAPVPPPKQFRDTRDITPNHHRELVSASVGSRHVIPQTVANTHIYESIDYASVGKRQGHSLARGSPSFNKPGHGLVQIPHGKQSPVQMSQKPTTDMLHPSVRPKVPQPAIQPHIMDRKVKSHDQSGLKIDPRSHDRLVKMEQKPEKNTKTPTSNDKIIEKVPASPKLSRISFFRRKSSDKKPEEKPTKLPKKSPSQKETKEQKDSSKIPKAVKQEQNVATKSKRFLRSNNRSSINSMSSSTSSKGTNA